MYPYDIATSNLANPAAGIFMMIIIVICIIAFFAWSVIWKGMALWRAARNGDKGWYVVMLLIDTAGLLEILYYFIFGKKAKNLNEVQAVTPTATLEPTK